MSLGKELYYAVAKVSTANTIVIFQLLLLRLAFENKSKVGKFESIKQIQIFLPLICFENLN